MLDPRWRKVLRDLNINRTRTLLVILSIAVGIFAVGTVQHLRTVILSELQAVYDESGAAHATIFTAGVNESLLDSLRKERDLAAVEGRSSLSISLEVAPGQLEPMSIIAIEDFEEIGVNYLLPQYSLARHPDFGAARTQWPDDGEIILERSALDDPDALPAGVQVGDTLLMETDDGRRRDLVVSGAVYDPNGFPTAFTGRASGYVTFNTFENLGGEPTYTQINLLVQGTPEQLADKAYITRIAEEIGDKIERSGVTVQRIDVPEPGKLVYQDIFDALALLLTPLGLLALFLSGFLVVNTISALMAQQVRQIGIMKSIGAQRSQIVRMYLGAVLIYSLFALVMATPATIIISGNLLQILGRFINVDFPIWSLPTNVLLVQIVVGLLVPLLAALSPVLRGAGVTVREAIADFGVGNLNADFISALLSRIRGLPRPLQYSLRNTFRRRARLLVTLLMLVLGGMIFMTIGSVRVSLGNLIEQGLAYNQFDVQIQFERTYRTAQIEQIVQSVPGVATVESWGAGLVTRIRPDGTESSPISITALPAESVMVQPTLLAGRWLLPEDESAIVISQNVLAEEPDIQVGDTIVLNVDEKEAEWTVVGIAQVLGGPPNLIPAYVNYPYFALYTSTVGQADSVQLQLDSTVERSAGEMANLLEETLDTAGLRVATTFTADRIRQISGGFFDIIVYLLSGMGVLIASVGALGLMGTMSINVLERTREIGVMRAIGASNGAVQWIVIIEGVFIGLLSWLIGAALAFPAGAAISSAVGQILFSTPLPYTFASGGVFTWLLIVAVLAALASFLPAWNASRLTVREVLAYE